jgi:hypothetical protein
MEQGRRQKVDDKEKLERRLKREAEEKFLENFSPCLQEEEEEDDEEEEEVETGRNIKKKIVKTPRIARLVKI